MPTDLPPSLHATFVAFQSHETPVLPVYVARSVVLGVVEFLRSCVPNEGIVKIYGHDCIHADDDDDAENRPGWRFARVTDWLAGEQLVTTITATFTDRGLREIELQRQEKYPDRQIRPLELGIAHSHPFGSNPEFSSVDRDTFCHFPYGPDNVHFLIDPTADFFKVYITHRNADDKAGPVELVQVPWGMIEGE